VWCIASRNHHKKYCTEKIQGNPLWVTILSASHWGMVMPDWMFDARKVVVVLAMLGAGLYWALTPNKPTELSSDDIRMNLIADSCRHAFGGKEWRGIAACRWQCGWFGPTSCLEKCTMQDNQIMLCLTERLGPAILDMWRAKGK